MTAPAATSPRVPGVTGWGNLGSTAWAALNVSGYLLECWSTGSGMVWSWQVTWTSMTIATGRFMRWPAESVPECAVRVRVRAEQALEQHLLAALGALRGEPVETP